MRLTVTLKSFIAEDNREEKLYINNVPKEHNSFASRWYVSEATFSHIQSRFLLIRHVSNIIGFSHNCTDLAHALLKNKHLIRCSQVRKVNTPFVTAELQCELCGTHDSAASPEGLSIGGLTMQIFFYTGAVMGDETPYIS